MFSDGLSPCINKDFVDNTFKFIPALFEDWKIAPEGLLLNPTLFYAPSSRRNWDCVFA